MEITPGSYRRVNVNFINSKNSPQFDLLKTAISHHRFTRVHPFSNGNGRTVRALTYGMLIKQGFNLEKGRIINPTAVFCSNRENYCNMLERADAGTKNGLLTWSEYVLTGLQAEVSKADKLADYSFLKKKFCYQH